MICTLKNLIFLENTEKLRWNRKAFVWDREIFQSEIGNNWYEEMFPAVFLSWNPLHFGIWVQIKLCKY